MLSCLKVFYILIAKSFGSFRSIFNFLNIFSSFNTVFFLISLYCDSYSSSSFFLSWSYSSDWLFYSFSFSYLQLSLSFSPYLIFLLSFASFSCFFLCLLSYGKYLWRRVAFREFKRRNTVFVMVPSKRISVTPKSRISLMFAVVIFIERSNLINYCFWLSTYRTF